RSPTEEFEDAVRRTERALAEFRIEGVATNVPLLLAILAHPEVRAARYYTRFLDDHVAALVAGEGSEAPPRFFASAGAGAAAAPASTHAAAPDGTTSIEAHLHGTVIAINVAEGETVRAGQQLLIIEAL